MYVLDSPDGTVIFIFWFVFIKSLLEEALPLDSYMFTMAFEFCLFILWISVLTKVPELILNIRVSFVLTDSLLIISFTVVVSFTLIIVSLYVLELPLSLVTVISWSVFVPVRVTKPVPVIVTLELVGVTLILYLSNPSSTYIVCSNKSLSKEVTVLPLMEMLSKVVTELFVVGKLTVFGMFK